MKNVRRYNIEGVEIEIPLRYDKISGIYLEEYPDFTANPVYTPDNAPIMFTGEDACEYAEAASEEPCIDCGSCRFYRQFSDTLIGVCGNEKRRKKS